MILGVIKHFFLVFMLARLVRKTSSNVIMDWRSAYQTFQISVPISNKPSFRNVVVANSVNQFAALVRFAYIKRLSKSKVKSRKLIHVDNLSEKKLPNASHTEF